METDPDVFERVTAVPGDLPEDTATRAAAPVEDDSISGLFERAAPGTEPPPQRHPGSDRPPVLAPTSSVKRPSRRNSRPSRTPSRPALERASRRPSTPPQSALELDLDSKPGPEPARRPDALEADLPLSDSSSAAFTLSPPSSSNDPELLAMKD